MPNDAKATAQVTLQLPTQAAANAAYGADNGKLWVVARPAAGARSPKVKTVTLDSLLKDATASGKGS